MSGTLSNHTGSAVSGIVVQAQTSYQSFLYRSEMTSFASSGSFPYPLMLASAPGSVAARVANGATVRWTVSFNAGAYYTATSMEVYPVQVQASAGGFQATARTFLPYWPGPDAGQPLKAAWIWPLIAAPQQGACPRTLATPALSDAFAADGRLSRLLSTGQEWASRDQLTWAIDPALLADAKTMTRTYFTGGSSACSGRTRYDASTAAREWLSSLGTATAGEPAFLTPYANADAAALSHAGLDADLRSAYQLGRKVAGEILPGTFGTADGRTADPNVLAAAWPAGGTADAEVMTSLASDGGISTVVLNSGEMTSSTAPYDGALARTTSGIGTSMPVLLADSGLTSLLGSATAASPAAARLAVTQGFLAQTAMIVAEGPSKARTLVIAPPPDWAPSQDEAAKLLTATSGTVPWLRPAGLGTLAAEAARVHATSLPNKTADRAELTGSYLDRVRVAESSFGLFRSLLYRPSPKLLTSLHAAFAVTESSAWRGSGSPGGWLAVTKFADYLSNEEHRVQIIASKKILLAGTSGTTPISVQNGLTVPIRVRLRASTPPGSKLTVGPFGKPLVVAPGKSGTVRVPVQSGAIGTTMMKLQLVTANGAPLTWTAQPLSVEVTRFGRALLLVIGGALAVLVLTAGVRLQRKRLADGRHRSGPDGGTEAGGAG